MLIAGSIFAFWFKKHIDVLKDTIEFLEKQNEDLKNYTPDIVATRLYERSKILESEIETLIIENENDKRRKKELQTELEETQQEARNMKIQLDRVQEILDDIDLPRDGKFKPEIARDVLLTVHSHKSIFVPIWLWGKYDIENVTEINDHRPFRYQVIFPGMFKMYIHFFDSKDNNIGYIHSPYLKIYNKDYFVTLLKIFDFLPKEPYKKISDEGSDIAYILPCAEMHSKSPIYPNIINLKIDVTEGQLEAIQNEFGFSY
jgi:hypothetical protein